MKKKKHSKKRPHHKHGHHRESGGWLYNYHEHNEFPDGIDLISQVVTALSERGEATISGIHVKPPEQATFMIRYERAPHGEQKLKLEIEWDPEEVAPNYADAKPEIS